MTPGRKSGWWFWPLLIVVFFAVQGWKDRTLIEGQAPPLTSRSLDGAAFAWDDPDRAGRPALLYFWASWCPICRAMQGNVEAIARDYPVISVALQSGTDQELRDYIRKHAFTLPVHSDPDGAIAARYGLKGVPALFIVDAHGTIRHAVSGYATEWGLRLRLWQAGLPS
jgi:thiol-disulfide isomerase/thioredoxin